MSPDIKHTVTPQAFHSMKTQNELELERQASQTVSGPLDKEWQNYGVSRVDDDDNLIDINKSPVTKT